MPTAALPRTAVPDRRPGFPPAIAAGLLALELLPLSVLLWSETDGAPGLLAADPPIRGTLLAAILTALAAVVLGVLTVDDPTRGRPPVARWRWPGFVGLLLAPTVVGAAFLLPSLMGGGLHARLWALVFLGIADGQMAAAACLRQAGEAIPASRFRTAALDCVSPWQRIRHAILPACAPALFVLAALTFVGSWSEFLLAAALRREPDRFTLGRAAAPENFVTAVYLFASLLMIFLGLWTLRACIRALTRPFAPN